MADDTEAFLELNEAELEALRPVGERGPVFPVDTRTAKATPRTTFTPCSQVPSRLSSPRTAPNACALGTPRDSRHRSLGREHLNGAWKTLGRAPDQAGRSRGRRRLSCRSVLTRVPNVRPSLVLGRRRAIL